MSGQGHQAVRRDDQPAFTQSAVLMIAVALGVDELATPVRLAVEAAGRARGPAAAAFASTVGKIEVGARLGALI
jgi:hypothetical protein